VIRPLVTLISIIAVVPAVVGGIIYHWGVPIAAFYWYRRNATRGRYIFLLGFAAKLGCGIARVLLLNVGFFSGLYVGTILAGVLEVAEEIAVLVALVGFALIVLREEKGEHVEGDAL
jgi:hypothetical protein